MTETLLLIEDEALLRAELARHFTREGWEVIEASSLARARSLLIDGRLQPLLVVSDMSLPDGNALDLLESVRPHAGAAEWIILTGYGGVADSVRALRLGAYDFLEKPCDPARLDLVVGGAARSARAQRQLRESAALQNRRYAPAAFIGRSRAAMHVREMLDKLSRAPISALLLSGETGTGKGLAARILHHTGMRREGPLIEVNCAALPHDLLESELFGHEPGAFTDAKGRRRGLMEQANGGTMFLDEIGELSPELQAKLLSAIEDRRLRRLGGSTPIDIDVQIIAASNRDLFARVGEGRFRSDLYHRITVFTLELPPLRNRIDDLEDLVPLFIEEYNAKAGKAVRTVPEAVWALLRGYEWPGNVRELRNAIERGVLLSDAGTLSAQWLQFPGAASEPPKASHRRSDAIELPLDGSVSLEEMEKQILHAALERCNGSVSAAARLLGASRETVRYRVNKFGLKFRE